jgi:catechol 2,3-dioxygenase-like lactoylglutathione lyase family enzyme
MEDEPRAGPTRRNLDKGASAGSTLIVRPLDHTIRMNVTKTTPPKMVSITPRLPVADLRRTIDFYTQAIGFSVGVLWPDDAPTFCTVERDSVCIGFHCAESAVPIPAGRGCELYIEVEDVRTLHASVRESVHIEWGPEVYHYGRREFAFRDPDGYLLIFTEPTDDPATCTNE